MAHAHWMPLPERLRVPLPEVRRDASAHAWSSRVPGFALLIAIGAPLLALLSTGFPNLFFEDDAYFYLQLAWNIGHGAGSTFDGLHVTNGYHLLWTGLLVPFAALAALLGLGKTAFVGIASAVGLAVAGIAAWTTFPDRWTRVLALMLFLFCGITMETVVLAALVLIALRMVHGETVSRPVMLAGIAAAAALSRVDFAPLVPLLALTAACDRNGRRLAAAAACGALAGVALHLGIERAVFGTWAAVSSAYKGDVALHQGGLGLLGHNLSESGNQLRVLALGVLAGSAAWSLVRTRSLRELSGLALVVTPVAAYAVLSEMRDWYFAVSLVGALFFASRAVRAPRPRAVLALAALLGLAFAGYLVRAIPDMRRTTEFVTRANRALTQDDVVYQIDGSGFTGYWLRAHVVNGDGLVNLWAYRRRLKRDDLRGYLGQIGAGYVLTNGAEMRDPVIDWHGLVVRSREARPLIDAGPTRNALVRFRLLSLGNAVAARAGD